MGSARGQPPLAALPSRAQLWAQQQLAAARRYSTLATPGRRASFRAYLPRSEEEARTLPAGLRKRRWLRPCWRRPRARDEGAAAAGAQRGLCGLARVFSGLTGGGNGGGLEFPDEVACPTSPRWLLAEGGAAAPPSPSGIRALQVAAAGEGKAGAEAAWWARTSLQADQRLLWLSCSPSAD